MSLIWSSFEIYYHQSLNLLQDTHSHMHSNITKHIQHIRHYLSITTQHITQHQQTNKHQSNNIRQHKTTTTYIEEQHIKAQTHKRTTHTYPNPRRHPQHQWRNAHRMPHDETETERRWRLWVRLNLRLRLYGGDGIGYVICVCVLGWLICASIDLRWLCMCVCLLCVLCLFVVHFCVLFVVVVCVLLVLYYYVFFLCVCNVRSTLFVLPHSHRFYPLSCWLSLLRIER